MVAIVRAILSSRRNAFLTVSPTLELLLPAQETILVASLGVQLASRTKVQVVEIRVQIFNSFLLKL